MKEKYELLDNNKDIEFATNILKAMAHPIRLKILCVLNNQELPVLEIVKQVGSSQSNISQHLDILRAKGILQSRRCGNKILCSIYDPKILEVISNMKNVLCTH